MLDKAAMAEWLLVECKLCLLAGWSVVTELDCHLSQVANEFVVVGKWHSVICNESFLDRSQHKN